MTISTDLDTWALELATVTGLPVTRDPDRVLPPCIFLGFPDAVTVTIGETIALDVPVHLVAGGHGGKAAGDWLLDQLVDWLAVLGRTEASAGPFTIDGVDYPAYTTITRLHVTPTPDPAAVTAPDPDDVMPDAEPTPDPSIP